MSDGDWGGGFSGGDSFTDRSSRSWFSRLGGALVGIPIGILLILGSFALLFWNEGRAVHTAQGLAEGRAGVVNVESGPIDAANEGKLVHVTGEASTDETLKDTLFGISAKAIRLRRLVQMFQWKETSTTKTRKKLGGGEERITTYNYNREWTSQPIHSSGFKHLEGHENPSWPFDAWTGEARTVMLGTYKLSGSLVGRIQQSVPIPVDQTLREEMPEEVKSRFKVEDGKLYRGEDPSHPTVGDMTVAFEQVKPQEVSVLARQVGDVLGPYSTRSGTTIERLQPGVVTAEAMIQQAETENKQLTWILRLVGFILMGVGFALVFSIFSVVADFVPFLGNIASVGTGFLAVGIALVLSLVTIALGWITYRPVMGISVLALAGLALFGLVKMGGKRRRATAAKGSMQA